MTNKLRNSWISRRDIFMIAIIISGGFITIFNQTVLSPALPSIMAEYQIDASMGQWLTTAFTLVNGIMVPITAYLVDRFSTRKLFIGSMLIFTVGTALAAVSPDFNTLMIARILQAIGAGIQMPLGAVVMMLLFPKEKRGVAMGIVGIVISFAPAIGPTFAGWVVDVWGWHMIFGLIVPVALLDILFAFFFLRNMGEERRPHLDWISVALSTLGFGGLLYGFSAAGSYGWNHPSTSGPLLIGAIALVFFIRRQLALKEPLLELRVLKVSAFAYATILAMVINAALLIGTIVTPIFLQSVLGYSAMFSGLLLMPGALFMCVMSPISGVLFDRFGPRRLCLVGLTILTVGGVMLIFIRENTSYLYLGFAYTIRAFGMSMVNMPVNTWGINALDNRYLAHGNAVINTARQVAGAIGTACLITIMTLVITANSAAGTIQATVWGIQAAFTGSVILTSAALVLAFFKVGRTMPGIGKVEEEREVGYDES